MIRAPARKAARTPRRAFAAALLCCAGIALSAACHPHQDSLEELRELQAAGRFAETVDPLRKLVDADPSRLEAQRMLGLALLRTGESGLAVWPLRSAAESPEHAVPAGILLTQALLDGRSPHDALRAIDRVLAIEPDSVEALLLRVEADLAASNPQQALEDIDRVVALEPENPAVLVPRVLALLAALRVDEAEAALEDARERIESAPEEVAAPARSRLCVARALFAFEKGDAEAADRHYEACLAEFSTDPLVIGEAIVHYDRTGRAERATEILRAALEKTGNPAFRMLLARRVGAQGDADEQGRLLREAAEQQASPSAWFALADYYVGRDEFEPALEAFERALGAGPDPPPMLRFAYADTLVQAGRLDQALAVSEQLDHDALRELIRGRVLLEQGDPSGALAAFEAGIRLWPNNASSRFLAGQAAERIGEFERAITEYRESVRSNAAQTRAGLALAELQAAADAPGAALDAARRYVTSHPDDPEGYLVSVRIAHRTGQQRIVAEGLARLAELPGQAPVARAEQAALLAADQGPAAAVASIEGSGLDLGDPENAPALRVLLDQLGAQGDHDGAERRSAAALASDPDAAVFHELRARVLRAAGRPPAQVREAYERALELDPADAAALAGLAELRAASGEREAALLLYDRAAAADPDDPEPARAAARLLLDSGSTAAAEQRLAALLERHPRDGVAALELARIAAERGDAERARLLAERAAWFRAAGSAELLESIRGRSAKIE